MSKLYDGSDDALTYGQALVLLAGKVAYGSEAEQREIVDAIRKEHGLELAEVKPVYSDARDQLIANYEAELETLKRRAAEQAADAKVGSLQAELEQLRAQVGDAPADAGEPDKKTAKASK